MGEMADLDVLNAELHDIWPDNEEETNMSTKEKRIEFRIAGVTFEDRQKKLSKVRASTTFQTINAIEVKLVCEPTNKFDENAVGVICDEVHLGYIPRALAAEVAPLLNAKGKKRWKVENAFITWIGNAGPNTNTGACVEALLVRG